jgi:hypothetical protein
MVSAAAGQFTPAYVTFAPVASVIHRPEVTKGPFGHVDLGTVDKMEPLAATNQEASVKGCLILTIVGKFSEVRPMVQAK